ncbi:MAG: BatA and WFA domain-containing protein [Phycisphaerales bacterium]
MSFLAPIAGLLAGGIGCSLVLVYWMLRLRRKPVRVSTTMLWKQSVRDLEGNVPWRMIRPSVLMILQLIAVILLAIAIARPVHDAGLGAWARGGTVVIVIDAGASMNSMSDERGRTRFERAKESAKALVREIGTVSASTKFQVIRAGADPRMMTGGEGAGSWRSARNSIDLMEPSDAPSDLGSAISLVGMLGSQSQIIPSELVGAGDSDGSGFADQQDDGDAQQSTSVRSIIWTDHDPAELYSLGILDAQSAVQRVADDFGEADVVKDNIGVVLAGAQRDQSNPLQCRVFATVAGVVDKSTGVVIRARIGDRVLASRAVELVPVDDHAEGDGGGAESAVTFVFDLETSGVVEIVIEREDRMMSDNRVWVMMPDPAPVMTTIIAPGAVADPLLVDGVAAVTGGRVEVIDEGDAIGFGTSFRTGLVIFDRVREIEGLMIPSMSFGSLGQDEQETQQQSSRLERVLSWDRGHPAMRDVELDGLRVTNSSSAGGNPVAGTPIVTGSQGVLISEHAAQGIRHLRIGFSIENSNWGVQVSLPIFLTNAVQYLLPGTSGSGVVHRTGEPIGERGVLIESVGVHEIDQLEVGVSLLRKEQTLRAGRLISTDTNDESMMNAGASIFGDGRGRVEIWRWFVLAGLCVLILEWVLDLARRRLI